MSRPQLLSVAAAAVVLLAVAVAVTSCIRRQASDDPDARSTRLYSRVKDGQADTIGQLADVYYYFGGRQHRMVVPFSQQGRDSVTVFCRQQPGPPYNTFHPVVALLLWQQSPEVELIRGTRSANGSNLGAITANTFGNAEELMDDGSAVGLLTTAQTYPTVVGTFASRYSILNDRGDESLHLGDNPYPLADGRVFLIDLGSDPVRVLQVNDDPATLLPANYPTKHDLRTFRGKLEAKHPAARDFWTR